MAEPAPLAIDGLGDELLCSVLLQLAAAGPAAALGAAAAACRKWRDAVSDEAVWSQVYARLFRTAIAAEPPAAGAAAAAPSAAAPARPSRSWAALCRARCGSSQLLNALRVPPPRIPGGQRPLHARVLEGALDPLSGSRDRALASPQTRRVASFEQERVEDEFGAAPALLFLGESACMVVCDKPLAPLPALEARTGRKIAYFEGRFRGGGSIGIVGSQQVFEVAGGRAHVGWHAPSFGYHSDDGALYFNDNARYDYQQQSYAGEGRGFGGASGAGDVVGCAVDLE